MNPTSTSPTRDPVSERIAGIGQDLIDAFGRVLDGIPAAARGPQALATELGLDKVLCSRLLKAIKKSRDPLAAVHHLPGPDPLARFLRAARKAKVDKADTDAAAAAAEALKAFVRDELGDRGSLEVLVSTWLPEVRREFELRRKQSAYRAMSQLNGLSVRVRLATVLVAPSATPGRLDLIWVMGFFGLRSLRPGATAGLSTQRMVTEAEGEGAPRHPDALEGPGGAHPDGYRLDQFCESKAAEIVTETHGEWTHHRLAGVGIGPASEVDLVLCEVNRAELPDSVPVGSNRMAHFSSAISTPTKLLLFDTLVHRDVYGAAAPELRLYDGVQGGSPDINDPANEAYRMHLAETLTPLGSDPANFRSDAIGSYQELLRHVFDRLGWDPTAFVGHRARIEYPLLGTIAVQAFRPPQR